MAEKLSLAERLALAGKRVAVATPPPPTEEPDTAPETTTAQEPDFESMSPLERIKARKAWAAQNVKSEPTPTPEEAATLTTVITAANLVSKGHMVEAKSDAPTVKAMENIDMEVIRQKIMDLEKCDGFDLKSQMDILRDMLLSNPNACQLMLPIDLGLMVRALRRMTGNKVAADLGRAKPRGVSKDKTPKLTAAEIQDVVTNGDWG